MLFYLYVLIALGAAAAALCAPMAWYAVLGVGVGTFFGLLVLHLFLLAIAGRFVDKQNPKQSAFGFYLWLLTATVELFFKLSRVEVKKEGFEKLPKGRCLFVQNHLSAFDPMSMYVALKGRRVFFISKKENIDIPVGGSIMAGAGVLALDRENNRQGVLLMRRAAELLEEEATVCVYPEGTRSKTGALGPFRDGCFKSALWGKAPIAVVTVRGSAEAAKQLLLRHSVIRFRVVRVFTYEEIADKRTDEIGVMVRECMEKDLSADNK